MFSLWLIRNQPHVQQQPSAGFQKLSNQEQIDVQGGGELKQLVSHRARGQSETKLILNCKWSLETVSSHLIWTRCETTSSCMSSDVCETNRFSLCCYLSVWLQDVNPVTSVLSVCFQGPVRKSLSRVDKQMRRFADIRRLTKTGHAVKISVEGNRMPLWFVFVFSALNSVGFIVFTF